MKYFHHNTIVTHHYDTLSLSPTTLLFNNDDPSPLLHDKLLYTSKSRILPGTFINILQHNPDFL